MSKSLDQDYIVAEEKIMTILGPYNQRDSSKICDVATLIIELNLLNFATSDQSECYDQI